MTWRERILAARERGYFNEGDYTCWSDGSTCLVGEQRERYGLNFNLEMTAIGPNVEHQELQCSILHAMHIKDFDEMDRLLDRIEDKALELKRAL